ncbi:CHAP domain-containing protein [Parapedobacter tibetensis]|uniref:CHAP domain-containing protein n=1 Tax=Parapedobacter tibetensis TaxID=2972951 RepID=UPI00214DABE8|nr:CHAP domain-containing protein [Parapedobacter tibetensis]
MALFLVLAGGYWSFTKFNFNTDYEVGQVVDSLNGVKVYYNGGINHVSGRNLTSGGYNLGLKYQCVEFVKRYYYEGLHHMMPDSYGHAKDFYDASLGDGQLNTQRGLIQYTNPSPAKPLISDLVVFSPTVYNRYGHVAIVASVSDSHVEIIQQNPGPYGSSRETFPLVKMDGVWQIDNMRIMGWLRLVETSTPAGR